MLKIGAAFALLAVLCAQPAVAQLREVNPEPPNGILGLSLQLGQAKGQFANYVKNGFGGGGYLTYWPGRNLPLGIRLHVMYLVYGSQTHRYPLVPGVTVDVTTRNVRLRHLRWLILLDHVRCRRVGSVQPAVRQHHELP
jgi:hypothetical protein